MTDFFKPKLSTGYTTSDKVMYDKYEDALYHELGTRASKAWLKALDTPYRTGLSSTDLIQFIKDNKGLIAEIVNGE